MSSHQQLFIGAYTSSDLLFIRTLTPLHVGVGRAGGIVDLPVQRDLYGYPTIYSSSIKGALRTACLRAKRDKCEEIFGSEPGATPTKPGKAMLLDAQLLLIPVRLLKGVYGYVTSPYMLKRFCDYIQIKDEKQAEKLSEIITQLEGILDPGNKAVVSSSEDISISTGDKKYVVINEEFWLEPRENKELINNIISYVPGDLRKRLELDKNKLLIVSDVNDLSIQIVEKSLIRLQRIRLEKEEKIVKTGALWSEEYVPQNTVFYTLALYANNEVKTSFRNMLGATKNYLILGGNETIGKGLTKFYFRDQS